MHHHPIKSITIISLPTYNRTHGLVANATPCQIDNSNNSSSSRPWRHSVDHPHDRCCSCGFQTRSRENVQVPIHSIVAQCYYHHTNKYWDVLALAYRYIGFSNQGAIVLIHPKPLLCSIFIVYNFAVLYWIACPASYSYNENSAAPKRNSDAKPMDSSRLTTPWPHSSGI